AMHLESVLDPKGAPSSRALVLGYLNSHFETGIRSPLDTAILDHTAAVTDDKKAAVTDDYKKIDEIPFDFERRRLSVVVEPVGDARRQLLITKGAPESILPLATDVETQGQIVPIDASARQMCETVQDRLSSGGRRVVAVACRWVEPRAAFSRADEAGLILAGYLSFADPLLPDAADAVAELRRDGVTVKILTGDNELVARHVGRSIGLDASRIVKGDDLDRLDDAALGHVAEQASVFAGVSPVQKNRILVALKRRGHIVGYIGDGINDAPSLHTADVGISVMSATDVARDAAAVILGRPGLRVLHRGILEGRRASGNMMKYLLMGTSSNFGNMFSMAAASVFLPFLPMLPTQILLNNFLYDLAQITIPGDNVDREYLSRPQRWDLKVVRDFMIFIGPVSSCYDFLT